MTNIALIIGKKNSRGVPGKNMLNILGRPCVEYSLIAAKYASIDKLFVSTDCEDIARIGKLYGAETIARPEVLAQSDTLTEDVIFHAYKHMKSTIDFSEVATITLFFSNIPAIDVNLLKQAISELSATDQYDSICSVAKYDMFSPARAKKLNSNGCLVPFVDLKYIENVSSLRDTQASAYFCDFSIQVLKPNCLEHIYAGPLPFKWQGTRVKATVTDFGFDIDEPWQLPVIEYWLERRGFTQKNIPWQLPETQLIS